LEALPELGWQHLAALSAVAFVAGLVDAIAGGGGLLTFPALLASGLPPHAALATNKGQSVFGAVAALVRYARAGLVDGERARVTFPAGFVGALEGAGLVLLVRPEILRPAVLVLLLCAASFVAQLRDVAPRAVAEGQGARRLALAIALVIGGYDGFFGPGTGTFLFVAFVSLLGSTAPRATADAKVVNFASNLASVVVFAARGVVVWKLALPMAAGQALGAWTGAHLAVKVGAKLIRAMVLLVVVALVARLGYDTFHSPQDQGAPRCPKSPSPTAPSEATSLGLPGRRPC
jgi:uncharacterized membrane protein YfcA